MQIISRRYVNWGYLLGIIAGVALVYNSGTQVRRVWNAAEAGVIHAEQGRILEGLSHAAHHAVIGLVFVGAYLLVSFFRQPPVSAIRSFMDQHFYWPGPLRRKAVRNKWRDSTLLLLGFAALTTMVYGLLQPPLEITHPVLSQKWGHGFTRSSGFTRGPGYTKQLELTGSSTVSTLLGDTAHELMSTAGPRLSSSGNDLLTMWVYCLNSQSMRQWQPDYPPAKAAVVMNTVLKTQVSPNTSAAQLTISEAAATPDHQVCSPAVYARPHRAESPATDLLTIWGYWVNQQSLQQCQPNYFLPAAVTDKPASVQKSQAIVTPARYVSSDAATAADADGVSTALMAIPLLVYPQCSSPCFYSVPSPPSTCMMVTPLAQQLQAMMQAAPKQSFRQDTHHAVMEASLSSTCADSSDAKGHTGDELADVADSASSVNNYSYTTPVTRRGDLNCMPASFSSSFACGTPWAASTDTLPADLPKCNILHAAQPLAEGDDDTQGPAFFDTTGKLLLGSFLLSLGGLIIPGIAVWWEFGTIAEGMNIVLEDVPEPMTLKLKTAGANAGRAITRTSSLIKTRVTKDLLSLPSTPPLHQVLVGADSIMGRCTLDHFSGDGKAEDEEQSAQPFAALPPAPLAPDDSEAGDEGQSAQPAAALPSASLPLAPLPPGGNKAGDEGQSAQPAVPLRSAPLPPAKTYTHPSLMPSHPFIPLSPPMHPSLVVHMDFQQQRRKLAVAEAVQVTAGPTLSADSVPQQGPVVLRPLKRNAKFLWRMKTVLTRKAN